MSSSGLDKLRTASEVLVYPLLAFLSLLIAFLIVLTKAGTFSFDLLYIVSTLFSAVSIEDCPS
jgi:hypothetical protein